MVQSPVERRAQSFVRIPEIPFQRTEDLDAFIPAYSYDACLKKRGQKQRSTITGLYKAGYLFRWVLT